MAASFHQQIQNEEFILSVNLFTLSIIYVTYINMVRFSSAI